MDPWSRVWALVWIGSPSDISFTLWPRGLQPTSPPARGHSSAPPSSPATRLVSPDPHRSASIRIDPHRSLAPLRLAPHRSGLPYSAVRTVKLLASCSAARCLRARFLRAFSCLLPRPQIAGRRALRSRTLTLLCFVCGAAVLLPHSASSVSLAFAPRTPRWLPTRLPSLPWLASLRPRRRPLPPPFLLPLLTAACLV